MNRKKNGFTLIEILAVVTIISLICIIVLPKIVNSLRNKKEDIDNTTRNIIITAAKLYVSEHSSKFDKEEGNTYCLPLTTLTKNEYLESPVRNVTDDKDITNTMSVKISYNEGFKYEIVNKKDCRVWVSQSLVDYLLSNSNGLAITSYTDGKTHQMYAFKHEKTEQTEALIDYRYIGKDPYNYVMFNDELWRIIGVFTVEDENDNQEERVKIIRNGPLSSKMTWDSNGVNDWSTSTLNTYLNGEYYNTLTDDAKRMIGDTKYYLGGHSTAEISASEFYNIERGITVYNQNDAVRSLYWVGKIGLIYPSDYSYAYANGVDDTCYSNGAGCKEGIPSNGYLFNTLGSSAKWTISPYSDSNAQVYFIYASGELRKGNIWNSYTLTPVVYLKNDVKITSGNGSEDLPYQLKM